MPSRVPIALYPVLLMPLLLSAESGGNQPVRHQAVYTRIYADDIEAVSPALGRGFVFAPAGAFTEASGEVVERKRSIKGASSGTASYAPFLRTDSSLIPLSANHSYRISCRYRILTTPDQGFAVLFDSPTPGAAGKLPQTIITGVAGDTGTVSHTSTLGDYGDYQAYWAVVHAGAISIDEIVITDVATGKAIASENAEGSDANAGAGLRLYGASVVSDPTLVLSGKASLRLKENDTVTTNAQSWILAPNTAYIIEFQYRILSTGSGDYPLALSMQPGGASPYTRDQVSLPLLLRNAPASGTFSSGALTASADSYAIWLSPANGADVVIDDIAIYRRDVAATSAPAPAWAALASTPFPRLGLNILGTTYAQAWAGGLAEGPPLRIPVDQVESRLAFHDVILALDMASQTMTADSLRRLRQLNPNGVILPYRLAGEQVSPIPRPETSDVSLEYDFLTGVADDWFLRDSKGTYVADADYPTYGIRKMNISPYCPPAGGLTYLGYLQAWLQRTTYKAGVWDGVFFDNLFGRINPHIPHSGDPARIDADYNRNGMRDETLAWINEMTRKANADMLTQLRETVGDSQLVVGNAGPPPELGLARFVNGYLLECVNTRWDSTAGVPSGPARLSQSAWRSEFQEYQIMQRDARPPRINVVQGCGPGSLTSHTLYSEPTAADFKRHRLAMGTALLNDGFYGYSLHGAESAPLWFDEYSVDATGTAMEDRANKGYLGQALSSATELTAPGTLVLQESFEAGATPASFIALTGASVSRAAADVISGTGSLVFSNPDHTRQGSVWVQTNPETVRFTPGTTYLLVFDWKVIETLDGQFMFAISPGGQALDAQMNPEVVAGDSGTSYFPFTIPEAGTWAIAFSLNGGGGKFAIDNVRLYQGGVGPWRRDFENGFVLVNPLLQARTFSATELAGTLKRSGIRRIKGTQAPDVNDGKPVPGGITVAPFDAVILLADHLDAQTVNTGVRPAIKPGGIISAANFGGSTDIAPGTWIEIYGSNLSASSRGWLLADFQGANAPTSLDGVSVTIGGVPAFVQYMSPTQVNVLVPSGLPAGPAEVIVSTPTGSSDAYIIAVQTAQPALLAPPSFRVDGKQFVTALAVDGSFAGLPSRPARPGETIVLYGIGFGQVTPNLNAGTLADRANSLANPIEIRFGSTPAALTYHGLAPGATGLYQFNLVVPDIPGDGAVPLTFSLTGTIPSQKLYIAVQR